MVTLMSTPGPVPMTTQSAVSALWQAFEHNRVSQRQHTMVMKVHSIVNDADKVTEQMNEGEEVVAMPKGVGDSSVPQSREVSAEKAKQVEKSIPKTWAALSAGKKLTSKGMSLKFVAPNIKNGKSVAQIDKEEVGKLAEVWANALVVYVLG